MQNLFIVHLFFQIRFAARLLVGGEEKDPSQQLAFRNDGKFLILQLTDMHLGSSYNDEDSIAVARKLIKTIKPDLIVYTGDLVNDYMWNGRKGYFQENWSQFADMCKEEKTLFTIAWGNHDMGSDLTMEQIGELQKTNPYDIFPGNLAKDKKSLSNFYLKVNCSKQTEKTCALLWIFDTRNKGCMDLEESEGCLDEIQTQFYKETQEKINKEENRVVNGLLFHHIPLLELWKAVSSAKMKGVIGERVNTPSIKSDFFSEMISQKAIKGDFFGHDHDSDFSTIYEGITFAYGRKSGFGSYGPNNFGLGGRVIELKENQNGFDFDTWVVNVNGDKENRNQQFSGFIFCLWQFFIDFKDWFLIYAK